MKHVPRAWRESPFEMKQRDHGRWVVLERGTGKLLLDNASKGETQALAAAPDKAA